MAMKACKECKAAVSTRAKKCPRCGVPNPTVSSAMGCISLVVTAVVVVAVCGGGLYIVGGALSSAGSAVSRSVEEQKQAKEERQAVRHAMNETVHVGYMSYEVREYWRQTSATSITDERFASSDGPYVFVRVAVRNNDKKARQIVPFKLVDSNGAEYSESSEAWMVDGAFGILESLNPSVAKEGIVVFVAPYGRGYDFMLSGGYWSAEDAFVKLEDPQP